MAKDYNLGSKWALIQFRAKVAPNQIGYWTDISHFVQNYHSQIETASDSVKSRKIERVRFALQSVGKHQTAELNKEIADFFDEHFGIILNNTKSIMFKIVGKHTFFSGGNLLPQDPAVVDPGYTPRESGEGGVTNVLITDVPAHVSIPEVMAKMNGTTFFQVYSVRFDQLERGIIIKVGGIPKNATSAVSKLSILSSGKSNTLGFVIPKELIPDNSLGKRFIVKHEEITPQHHIYDFVEIHEVGNDPKTERGVSDIVSLVPNVSGGSAGFRVPKHLIAENTEGSHFTMMLTLEDDGRLNYTCSQIPMP